MARRLLTLYQALGLLTSAAALVVLMAAAAAGGRVAGEPGHEPERGKNFLHSLESIPPLRHQRSKAMDSSVTSRFRFYMDDSYVQYEYREGMSMFSPFGTVKSQHTQEDSDADTHPHNQPTSPGRRQQSANTQAFSSVPARHLLPTATTRGYHSVPPQVPIRVSSWMSSKEKEPGWCAWPIVLLVVGATLFGVLRLLAYRYFQS